MGSRIAAGPKAVLTHDDPWVVLNLPTDNRGMPAVSRTGRVEQDGGDVVEANRGDHRGLNILSPTNQPKF
jgi:hypothetical protein